MTFQIIENFGQSCYGYLYFDTNSEDPKVWERLAVDKVEESYRENCKLSFFGNSKPAFPTITVREYDNIKKRKVRSGIQFKTQWR